MILETNGAEIIQSPLQFSLFSRIYFNAANPTVSVRLRLDSSGFIDFSNSLFDTPASIKGSIGNDTIIGGSGNDTIEAGAGNDSVNGGAGNDTFNSGTGSDIFVGGTGNDTLVLISGSDDVRFVGESGRDVLYRDRNASVNSLVLTSIEELGGFSEISGNDSENLIDIRGVEEISFSLTLRLFGGDDIFYGSDFYTGLSEIFAGRGNDRIFGSSGVDRIRGEIGNDTMFGGGGNDLFFVSGDGGLDVFNGGEGFDTLALEGSTFYNVLKLDLGSSIEQLALNNAELRGTESSDQFDISGIQKFDFQTQIALLAGDDYFFGSDYSEASDDVNGGNGNDTLIGNAGNDRFTGDLGNDLIDGGLGDDTLFIGVNPGQDTFLGGAGVDTLRLTTDAQIGDLITGPSGSQIGNGFQLRDVERIVVRSEIFEPASRILFGDDSVNTFDIRGISIFGGQPIFDMRAGNDTFIGSRFGNLRNVVIGGLGDDGFFSGAGNDDFEGNDGLDTVYYLEAQSGINIDLSTQIATGDGVDSLKGMENIVGSNFSDRIIGSAVGNRINGEGGDDYINAGLGIDTINGGEGFDTISYATSTSVVRVRLGNGNYGFTTEGGQTTDSFLSIENVEGSSLNDYIIGNSIQNKLFGLGSNDILIGDGPLSLSAAAQQVKRLYISTLDRGPDDAGWQDWTTRLEGGQALTDIAAGFVGSQEFLNKYGQLDNGRFVTELYRNVLDREPDQAGFNVQLNALNSGALSRTQLVVNFSESQELKNGMAIDFHAGQVYRLYGATLARIPDAAGFETWTDALSNGRGLVGIASGFVGSTEFQTRFNVPDSASFVTLLYQNVLNRLPDQSGLTYWTNLLDSGAQSRTQVVTGFSESGEYINGTRTATDAFMRNVMSAWSDTLVGGTGNDSLTGGRGSDRFVFTASEGGNDVIYGFESYDTLELNGFGFSSAGQALGAASQQGANVVLNYSGGSITFADTQLSVLQSMTAQGWVFG